MYLLKMSGPQIWLYLFSFQSIASKDFNGLTTIDIRSWLGAAVVTHPLWVQEVLGSIPGSDKGFNVWFFVLLLLCFYFFVQNTLFIAKYCNSFYNVNLFSILNVLRDLWSIIRVKRYKPSIFNIEKYTPKHVYHKLWCRCSLWLPANMIVYDHNYENDSIERGSWMRGFGFNNVF